MKTWVMGDIHGAHKALKQCLERACFNNETDTLIQLGDVSDKRPEVYECVETLLQINSLIAVKGNHDQWIVDFIESGSHTTGWKYGGDATVLSYQRHTDKGRNTAITNRKKALSSFKPSDIPVTHTAFFMNQVPYYTDEHNNLFVHGGFKPGIAVEEQRLDDLIYDRELWKEAMVFDTVNDGLGNSFFSQSMFKNIYIGHTPTTNWHTDQPMRAANVWNLDTGAGQHGRLSIMDTITGQYWQSDPVDELYR